ncbi:MAG: hypothetical protein IKO73_07495 [Bacteroidaceae bacterium]|nr:hypothetical protein [Bacteroidaceae bacterium]
MLRWLVRNILRGGCNPQKSNGTGTWRLEIEWCNWLLRNILRGGCNPQESNGRGRDDREQSGAIG